MKKHIKRISLMIVCIILLLVGSFCIYYFSRFRTLSSIQKVTSYEDGYNLYQIDIKYDYDLDQIIDYGITDNQSMIDAIIKEALPLLPVKIKAPDFGCTAFTMTDNQNQVHMGRNYDFKLDTSAMLVYCTPQNGYKSVAFAALDNISANTPDESMKKKLATLTSPFICLDGMNEKGVSIAVLTLDSEPVFQNTGKPTIATTLAIRLVLDRAASTQEAVDRNRQISRRIKKHLWLSNRSWARDVHSFGILHSWGALAGKSCSAQASSIWLIAGAFRRTQSK